MLNKQIELEKQMTQLSIDNYRREIEKAKQNQNYGNTCIANRFISSILVDFVNGINNFLESVRKGEANYRTPAANVIIRLDVESVAFITAKVIFSSMYSQIPLLNMYRTIGQALEDEWKMREFKSENKAYYEKIQKDLDSRGAKSNRKKIITNSVFKHRLDYQLENWTFNEKYHVGIVLTKIFAETTDYIEFKMLYKKGKSIKIVEPTVELAKCTESLNEKLEVMQPLFLPMVYPPKEWTSILEGGYLSPYIKKNKLIKNNDKDYLTKLQKLKMPIVYEAINHIQATEWQVNNRVLEVALALWEEGKAVAELPDREDEPLEPFPFPDMDEEAVKTPEEEQIIKNWKRNVYETHKRNVSKRSVRILVSQILRIANQFKDYEKIYFPYQMDFRGRLYPIPVLLQPQGTDLAKGLLHFAEGKKVDERAVRWLQIHGANTYGYDKESYDKRVEWTKSRTDEIISYAQNPLLNRGWTEADKPFQFLAFCFEYNDYLTNPDEFKTHIPIQLDGTCNGLQHYSALLRDIKGGQAVNLVNSNKPSDIYAKVAERLERKLKDVKSSTNNTDKLFALRWLNLGINRKLTKRPVMVLPYGGTPISCRAYISEYLKETYSSDYLWKHFGVGGSPTEAIFKASTWLSKHLWESITETIVAATEGMSYLRKLTRAVTKQHKDRGIEWTTPAGLVINQAYLSRKAKVIHTELYGKCIRTKVGYEVDNDVDIQRQLNGICPNFIHSLDAACLMLYICKCKAAGINSIMSVHDCYGVLATDTDLSAKFLREAFVEIYRQPILENFTAEVAKDTDATELPELPPRGNLDIEEVLRSEYFFN